MTDFGRPLIAYLPFPAREYRRRNGGDTAVIMWAQETDVATLAEGCAMLAIDLCVGRRYVSACRWLDVGRPIGAPRRFPELALL